MDWQPIETMPKDGTEVLCWRNGEIRSARWYSYLCDGKGAIGGLGWSHVSVQPTHWAPMPPGPGEAATPDTDGLRAAVDDLAKAVDRLWASHERYSYRLDVQSRVSGAIEKRLRVVEKAVRDNTV